MKEDRFPPELEALFASYRQSLPDREGSANFMPDLWAKIDSRKTVTYSFRRMASRFVTAAAAITLVLSAALWVPSQNTQVPSPTYVEVLADLDSNTDDTGHL